MNGAQGSRRRLIFCVEDAEGTAPTSPTWKKIRTTGGSGITVGRQTIESSEIRDDRQSDTPTLGNKSVAANVPIEFSYEGFEDFLESVFGGKFAAAYALTALVVTVVATAKTFTRSTGSWITDGVKVGDKVTFGGFTNSGNNGTFAVTAVTALVVTCSAATGLTDESAASAITATTTRKMMTNGTTRKTFTFEEGFQDIAEYLLATGIIGSKFSLDLKNNAKTTGSFDFIGLTSGDYATASAATTVEDAETNTPFDSLLGSIKEGGSVFEASQSLSLSVDGNASHKYVLFKDNPDHNSLGRLKITGTLTTYFKDATMAQKFLSRQASSIAFTLTDLSGNSYTFTLPKIVYTGDSHTTPEDDVILTLPFTAGIDSTTGKMIEIEKIPA